MPNTYLTKVITDTSPDFGDNPQTVQESGTPASVTVENLVSNTGYWTKAEIWRDGVLNDTSEVETFTTIQAGVMTLEFIQDGRSGYGYDISWRYTSTYAPSWCTLSINGQVFQGFIDSANSDLDFFITGLTPSTTYPYTVTLGDIYGETVTANGSLTTTYVNTVTILSTSADEFSVICNVSYVVDGGFYNGWVDVWYDYQDPSTDLSLAHYYFNEGDTAVVCDGLNDNTSYLFRASITLDDRTTIIVSNVKAETTDLTTLLSFTDVSGSINTLKLTKTNAGGLAPTVSLEYSTDKHNWTTWTETNNERTLEIPANGTVWLRGDNANGFATTSNDTDRHVFSSTGNINADGDIMRIINKTKGVATAVPPAGFRRLFANMTTLKKAPAISATTFDTRSCQYMFIQCSGLTDISNINLENISLTSGSSNNLMGMFYQCTNLRTANVFNGATIPVSTGAYRDMFAYCSSLASVPSFTINETTLPQQCCFGMLNRCNNASFTDASGIHLNSTNLGWSCYYQMFEGCSYLATPPTITKNNTSVGQTSMGRMFKNCTSLTTGIDLRNVTSVGTDGLDEMYNGCTLLSTAYAPTITWDTNKSTDWLNNVAASGTLYADERILNSIPTNNVSGCPTGWNIHEDEFADQYFTIINESDSSNTITVTTTKAPNDIQTIDVSTNGGLTWSSISINNESGLNYYADLGTLRVGEKMLLRHTGAMVSNYKALVISASNLYSVSGNIASLCFGDNFTGEKTMPAYAYYGLFANRENNTSYLISAKNLSFASYNTVASIHTATISRNALKQTFQNCYALREAPDLSFFTFVDEDGMYGTFLHCESLIKPAKMNNLTQIAARGCQNTFAYCYELTEGPDITEITLVGTDALDGFLAVCKKLTKAYAPTYSWNTSFADNWLYDVYASGTLYADSSISGTIPLNNTSGCPSGWTISNI